MNPCVEYEPSIERLLAEEISADERDRLLRHAEGCAGCREFVDLHHRMLEEPFHAGLPADEELDAVRRRVIRTLRDEQRDSRTIRWAGLALPLRAMLMRPAFAGAGLAALMLAMLAAGFIVGRERGVTVLEPLGVAPELEREARLNRQLSDVENSPYLYSNVEFSDIGGGDLELRFDVTRHLRLVRSADDPLVAEVLAQSLVNPSQVAARLATMDYARRVLAPKVQEALIITLFNDENPAVRLRALEILAEQPQDPEIQAAFLAVLRGEDSVPMRMKALDYLAVNGPGLGELLQELNPERDRALLVRAADYAPLRRAPR